MASTASIPQAILQAKCALQFEANLTTSEDEIENSFDNKVPIYEIILILFTN